MERGVSSSGAAPNGSFDRMESSYRQHEQHYSQFSLLSRFRLRMTGPSILQKLGSWIFIYYFVLFQISDAS
jgi:hypothetical protein